MASTTARRSRFSRTRWTVHPCGKSCYLPCVLGEDGTDGMHRYDLSTAFGEPFQGRRVTVTSSGSPTIDWPKGSNPGGSQVKVGDSSKDVVFTAYA